MTPGRDRPDPQMGHLGGLPKGQLDPPTGYPPMTPTKISAKNALYEASRTHIFFQKKLSTGFAPKNDPFLGPHFPTVTAASGGRTQMGHLVGEGVMVPRQLPTAIPKASTKAISKATSLGNFKGNFKGNFPRPFQTQV